MIIYSERAEKALKQAQELKKSLDEADVAQQKARDAIEQANEDIALARADLEKVKKLNFLCKSFHHMKIFPPHAD